MSNDYKSMNLNKLVNNDPTFYLQKFLHPGARHKVPGSSG